MFDKSNDDYEHEEENNEADGETTISFSITQSEQFNSKSIRSFKKKKAKNNQIKPGNRIESRIKKNEEMKDLENQQQIWFQPRYWNMQQDKFLGDQSFVQ